MTLGEKEFDLPVTTAMLSHNHIRRAFNKAARLRVSTVASVHQEPRLSDTQGQQHGGWAEPA